MNRKMHLLATALAGLTTIATQAHAVDVLAEYHFEDSLGMTVLDSSHSEAHLTADGFGGSVPFVESPFGEGIVFDRTQQRVQGSSKQPEGQYENIAVECWFKRQGNPAPEERLLQLGDKDYLYMGYWNGDRLIASIRHSKPQYHVTVTSPLPSKDAWHHLFFLRDGNRKEIRFYIDGTLAGRRACPDPVKLTGTKGVPSVNLYLGNGGMSRRQYPYGGMLDEVRVLTGRLPTDEEITHLANIESRTAHGVDAASRTAVILTRARRFLSTLRLALHVLEESGLSTIRDTPGNFLSANLRTIEDRLRKLETQPNGTAAAIRGVYVEMEALEKEMIEQSIALFAPPVYSPRRLYEWYIRRTDPTIAFKKRNEKLLGEIDNQFMDWARNTATLKTFGLTVEADIEQERIRIRKPAYTGQLLLNSMFEQTFSFYKAVAIERFRLAERYLAAQREWDALAKCAEIRRELGAAIADLKDLKREHVKTLNNWKQRGIEKNSFVYAAAMERASDALLEQARAQVYAQHNDVPVIRPGASFYSGGRLAMGGNKQGLPAVEVRGATFYRRHRVLAPYENENYEWQVSFEVPDSAIMETEVEDASWTHSHRVYTYRHFVTDATVRQDCWWSMLSPGTLFDTHGPSLVFSDNTLDSSVAPDKVIGVFDGKPWIVKQGETIDTARMTEGWLLLLWENNAPQMPVLVFFERRPDRFEWLPTGLVAHRAPEIGKTVMAMPYGSVPQPAAQSKKWKKPPEAVVAQCRKMVEHLGYYPLELDEFFSTGATRDAVGKEPIRVWNRVASVIELKDDWKTEFKAYTPIPPLFALGIESGVDIRVEQPLSSPLYIGKYGPFQSVAGTALSYTMPVVRMWNRHCLRPTGEEELLKVYNDHFRDDTHNYDFTKMGGYSPGYCMMSEENRDWWAPHKSRAVLDQAFAQRNALSHAAYPLDFVIETTQAKGGWLSGWRGNWYDIRSQGDIQCYTGLRMLGAYTYAKFAGHWDLIEKHWEAMRRLYSSITFRQGWASPGHDCMTTGWIFNNDMFGDPWRLHHIMATLARVLDHSDDEALAAYQGARALHSFGITIHRNALALNRHIMVGNAINDKKATVTPGTARAKIQYGTVDVDQGWQAPFNCMGSGTFDYPMFGALLDYFPENSRQWIGDWMDGIPSWWMRDGAYRGPNASHQGAERTASAWHGLKWLAITTYDRENVREIYRKGFAPAPGEKITSNNGSKRWMAQRQFKEAMPFVIAQNDPLWLVEWDTALLDDGTYDRQTRTATVTLDASRPGTALMISLVPPTAVSVNGKTLSTDDYAYDAKDDSLRVPFGYGPQEIVVALKRHTPKDLNYPDFAGQPLGRPLKLARAPKPGKMEVNVASGDIAVGECEPIDIRAFCNMGFVDKVADDRRGGTFDGGEAFLFPAGKQILRGVPFTIIDPDQNGGKSCIVLNSRTRDYFPVAVTNIPVNKVFKRLFFFHGTSGEYKTQGLPVMTYVLHFKDRDPVVLRIRNKKDIYKFKGWMPQEKDGLPDLANARAVPYFPLGIGDGGLHNNGHGASGYVMMWNNTVRELAGPAMAHEQQGLAVLESIDILSARSSATPMVFAITGELVK